MTKEFEKFNNILSGIRMWKRVYDEKVEELTRQESALKRNKKMDQNSHQILANSILKIKDDLKGYGRPGGAISRELEKIELEIIILGKKGVEARKEAESDEAYKWAKKLVQKYRAESRPLLA